MMRIDFFLFFVAVMSHFDASLIQLATIGKNSMKCFSSALVCS
jgi:hypothetical protein